MKKVFSIGVASKMRMYGDVIVLRFQLELIMQEYQIMCHAFYFFIKDFFSKCR